MKLLRYGPIGTEKPACVDAHGNIRDLSSIVPDLKAEHFSPEGLGRLRAIDLDGLSIVDRNVRIAAPCANIGKTICVGLNYADHAAEAKADIPAEPVLFSKWSRPTGPDDPIVIPRQSVCTDWEVELGVLIGTTARYVTQEDALKHVAGYCIVNDVSERDFQMSRGGTWDKGKGCDSFLPVGPWLVTADEIPDPQNLSIWLEVNGVRYQDSHTGRMLFAVDYLIHYISQFTTLHPGDLISTGTPAGVGLGQVPPRYLQPGDIMRLGVEHLGEQRQKVVASR